MLGNRRWGWLSAGLVCVSLVLAACGLSPNWPEVACSPELEVGTVCLPGEHRAVTLFDGATTEAEAATRQMSDPLAGVLSTTCTSLPPDVYTICVSTEGGITVITPVVVPDGARISFAGDGGLADIPSVQLQGPLGIRRQNAQFRLFVRDSKDKLLGEIGLGFYP